MNPTTLADLIADNTDPMDGSVPQNVQRLLDAIEADEKAKERAENLHPLRFYKDGPKNKYAMG